VERAVAAGIVVVVSAGNEGMSRTTGEVGYGGVTSPGNAPSAITVGAVDTRNTITRADDQVPAFSSRGPTWYDGFAKPDLVAPGRRVVSFMAKNSTLYNSYQPYRVDVATRTYMTLSGTSMSAAVTSGVVALMIEASRLTNPGRIALPPNAIKAVLQYTASPLAGVDELTQGAGSLNPAGALALVGALDPTQPVGAWWLKFGVSPHSLLANGEQVAWGQQILWGDHVLTGDTVYVNQPAWSKAIVWGNSVVWGNSIVWGNAIVWGNSVVWGNAIVWGNTVIGYNTSGGVQYGDQVDWSTVDPNSIVWGNLSGVTQLPASKSVNQFTPVW
jgi:serine protease AprX